MSMGTISQSSYSKTVKTILSRIHDATALNDSVYEVATDYFRHAKQQEDKLTQLQMQVRKFEKKPELSSAEQKQLAEAQSALKLYVRMLDDSRLERYRALKALCLQVLQLTEGESFDETVQMSSKFLGTIQLLAPSNGKYVAPVNQKFKHLYKGVLSLRLLDRLLLDNELNNNYVQGKVRAAKEMLDNPEAAYKADYSPFRDDVQLPLLMAAILQDIGTYHPDALAILKGSDGDLDEFRVLDDENRVALLKINYQETLNYVTKGLACDRYVGNSKKERELFNQNEQDKLNFVYQQRGISGILLSSRDYYAGRIWQSTAEHYSDWQRLLGVGQGGVALYLQKYFASKSSGLLQNCFFSVSSNHCDYLRK